MSDEISLSVEETNKLRAKIGLPLLPVEKPTVREETRGPKSASNELSVEETNKLRASLGLKPIVIEEAERGRAEESSVEEPESVEPEKPQYSIDTQSEIFYKDAGPDWLDRVGKGEVKAGKEQKAVSEASESADVAVAHGARELAEVKDGDIFTLEDNNVLEDGPVNIVNEKIQKAERLRRDEAERKKTLAVKFGARYEDDEEDDSAEIAQMSGSVIIAGKPEAKEKKVEKEGTTRFESLFDDLDEKPGKAAKFKKRSSKKKSAATKRKLDDDVDAVLQPMVTTELRLEEDENEDEEIQRVLAKNRERSQKKRKLLTPEQLAQEIQSHERVDTKQDVEGFVFDDTSEFLNSIRERAGAADEATSPNEDEVVEARTTEAKEVKFDGAATQNAVQDEEPKKDVDAGPEEEQSSGPSFRSMADTLSYLRSQKAVSVESEQEKAARKAREQKVKEAELQRIAISIEERTLKNELEQDDSYQRLPKEEQEAVYDRILNERLTSKGIIDVAKRRETPKQNRGASYNPKVQLQYKDKSGNELNAKEAFKELSHKYHGTAPKNKKKKAGSKSYGEHVVG